MAPRLYLLGLFVATVMALARGATVEETCTMQEGSLKDKATGISFSLEKAFDSATSTKFSLLGAGPRSKNLYVVAVKVYAVGLYVNAAQLSKVAGSSFKGKSANDLSKTPAYYEALLNPQLDKVVSLVFARNVGAAKVVDALTSISGVEKPVLDQFSKAMLGAIGGSIDTNEVISLGWSPKDGSLWAEVRGKNVGSWKSAQLGKGIFDLYLGAKPISEEAKTGFAALAPKILA